MSQPRNHLPGDVAPLPSPTAHGGPVDDYLPPLEQTNNPMAPPQSQHPHFQAQPTSHPQAQSQRSTHEQYYSSIQPGFEPQAQQTRPSSFSYNPSAQSQKQTQPSGAFPPTSAPRDTEYPQQQQPMGSGPSGDASIHLRDFSLLAEAAKRAQVACVTRDMEDVSL